MRRLILPIVLLPLAISLVLPSSAEAGGPDIKLSLARQESGPYRVGPMDINIAPGSAKSVFLRVKNRGDEKLEDLLLYKFGTDWSVKYFRNDNLLPQNFTFNLPSGKAKSFRVRIKAPSTPDETCVTNVVELNSDYFSTIVRVNDTEQLCAIPI